MRLKQIKLAGFKSFVDPTKIPFLQALTAIIGPNGCGKSNVIDAVRWVLGESSAKHLRGDSMADVIFNGSSARKPVSVAGVELIFENKEGRLAGQYASYEEIAVKRQVSRDGESWYFLNGQKCRRKDITDLFMGTGLGPRSYAIIEQGTISRLIESKPQDLRTFIEEAAGISRYKERRRETENRIRHTRENLERLGDIRSELGKQLDKLAQQAKAAKQYRELKQAERKTHAELLVMRYQELQAQMASLSEQISAIEVQQAAAQSLAQTDELQTTELQVQLAQLAEQEQRAVEAYYLTGTEIAKLEQQLQNQKQRDAQLETQLAQVKEHIQQNTDKLNGYKASLSALELELAKLGPQHDEQQELMDELQSQWEMSIERSQQQAEVARQQAADVSQHKLQLELRRSQLAHQQQLLQHKQQQSREQQAQLSALMDGDLASSITPLQQDIESLDDALTLQNEINHQQEQSVSASTQALDEARHSAEHIQQQLTATKARHELVEQWLTKQEQQSDKPQLWQSLTVENGWETAAELALNGLLTLPVGVTETEMGFQALASQSSQSEFLQAKVNLAPWLAGLKWAKDIHAAKELLPQLTSDQRIVTADGYLLGQGFLITKTEGAQSLVQLSKEQAQLAQNILDLQQSLQIRQDKMTDLAAILQQQRLQLTDGAQKLHQWQLDKATKSMQLSGLIEQVKARVEQQSKLDAALSTSLIDIERLSEQYELLAEQEMELDETLQASEDIQRQLIQDTQADSVRHQALKGRITEVERQLSATATGLQAVTMRMAVSTEQIELQQVRVNELIHSRESVLTELAKVAQLSGVQNSVQLTEQLTQLLKQQHEQQQGLKEVRQQQSVLTDTLNSIGIKQKQELGKLEDLTQSLSTLKLRREGIKGQANSQLEALQEQQIILSEILGNLPAEGMPDKWQSDLDQIRQKIVRLGAINLAAIEEFEQQSERKSYLDHQDDDLNKGLATLEEAIRKIDKETRSRFKTTFDSVNEDLGRLFPKVFGGGRAYLALTDDDLLETGVTIMAQPPGKKNSTIHLLSGGEKALTALSLVFAIFRLNPAPFCMLDEVDAPLDDANVERFCRLLKEMSQSVQFIYISHNKITMEMADQLIGVTMHEPGVSRIVAVDIEQAVAMADAG
ncbi:MULTISPECIES: chromosome segregation protein SMC [Shewanella]|uniref:chromosome segregation protein SMC n=1 Tax=Shewanella TaxID=22 RepID=UPI0021D7E441|nr:MULTISPECIES: chromosome segregation protein SMC [unclassified Shewanella]MCU7985927.1 chromosome segregation protein SMC [Shewanella sp. SW24]MCU8020460.1 chromosome segregation protein SMC [Shewanella sp. SM78]MCU8031465.1 chromosome segregation protein SMC [Shewanella sp. SM73]MCU8044308.1 chromosome segregation protein SMC [Shewanella sp. SM68]MCU8048390.1 chromosome segregation protein SMC [Shewanella sp. SM65]